MGADSTGEVFALPEKSPIRRMSKGMQKQAAFWLTMSCRPKYLVLDFVDRRAVHQHLAAVGAADACEVADNRGFPRAIGSDQAVDPAVRAGG